MKQKTESSVSGSSLQLLLKSKSEYLIIFVLFISLVLLFGWLFGVEIIKRPFGGVTAMNPCTALGFVILSLSFLSVKSQKYLNIGYGLAALLTVLALLRMSEVMFNFDLRIDQFLFNSQIETDIRHNLYSQMAPVTAINFFIAGIVMFFLRGRSYIIHIYQALSLLVISMALFSILCYTYSVEQFYGVFVYIPMTPYAAGCFLLFGLSVLFYTGGRGFMQELTSDYSGGVTGRVLIPFAIVVPATLGFLRLYLSRNRSFTIEFGTATLIFVLILIFVLLIWFVVYSLNEKDKLKEEVEAEVRLAYVLLHSSIESYEDVLIFSIDRDFKYLNYNKAFKEATHRAYGTEVKRGGFMLDSITIEQERQKIKTNCERALAGESLTTVDIYGEFERHYFETRYNPITRGSSDIIGVTILSANVTSRIEKEEEIMTLNKELESFSYSIAHDLRAPLRIIDGYSNILLEDYFSDVDEECQRIIRIISGNARKMGRLIDDLLNFSKLGRLPVNKSKVNAEGLIKAVVEEQTKVAGRDNIKVRIGNLEQLYCDEMLMHHVFSNLISNAIKYSEKRSASIIEIDSKRNDHIVTYTITDNGAGFDMKYADKLFGVFQRLHKENEFEGTGVGLAIVQRIISKHGGKIWAEAEIDNGATFSFSLPSN